MVCLRIRCLESLQDKSDRELKVLLGNAREEEVRRLCRAIHNLKKYTGNLTFILLLKLNLIDETKHKCTIYSVSSSVIFQSTAR